MSTMRTQELCFSMGFLLVHFKVLYRVIPAVFSVVVGEVVDLREEEVKRGRMLRCLRE